MPASTFSTSSFVCKGLAAVFLCNRRTPHHFVTVAQPSIGHLSKRNNMSEKNGRKNHSPSVFGCFFFNQTNQPKHYARGIAEFLRISWSSCCSFWSSSRWSCSWRNSWQVRSEVPVDIHNNHVGVLFFMLRKQNKYKNWKLHYLWSTPAGFIFGQMFNASFKFGVSVEICELFLSKKIELFLTLWELLEKAQTTRIFGKPWELLLKIVRNCQN